MPSTANPSWAPPPLNLRLDKGAVHVWRADLTAVPDDLLELLSAEERARAKGLKQERDRQLWTRAHGVLRALLGRYLDTDPRALRLAAGAHGKPALLADPASSTAAPDSIQASSALMSFNLSHSGQLALYAFTETGAVGVDVEVARRPIDEVAIASRTLGPVEARRLAGLEPAIREREFRRLWVRHEAELKCRGTGFGGAASATDGYEPWIAELEVGPTAAGAVAAEHAPSELRCWDWTPSAAITP